MPISLSSLLTRGASLPFISAAAYPSMERAPRAEYGFWPRYFPTTRAMSWASRCTTSAWRSVATSLIIESAKVRPLQFSTDSTTVGGRVSCLLATRRGAVNCDRTAARSSMEAAYSGSGLHASGLMCSAPDPGATSKRILANQRAASPDSCVAIQDHQAFFCRPPSR
ncbi:hypothetical protein VTI74DRAFT_2064 [Chaetomium olivicolor]